MSETCGFRLPEDAFSDDRVWEPSGVNYFLKFLGNGLECGDLGEIDVVFTDAKSPQEEAASFARLQKRRR